MQACETFSRTVPAPFTPSTLGTQETRWMDVSTFSTLREIFTEEWNIVLFRKIWNWMKWRVERKVMKLEEFEKSELRGKFTVRKVVRYFDLDKSEWVKSEDIGKKIVSEKICENMKIPNLRHTQIIHLKYFSIIEQILFSLNSKKSKQNKILSSEIHLLEEFFSPKHFCECFTTQPRFLFNYTYPQWRAWASCLRCCWFKKFQTPKIFRWELQKFSIFSISMGETWN